MRNNAARESARPRDQSGAVIILAMAFVFLLTYIALAGVDLAAVEARLAESVRDQTGARVRLEGATKVIVAREMARLQLALAQGDEQLCATPGFCDAGGDALLLDDGAYRAVYQTRVPGPATEPTALRETQDRASSAVHYRSSLFEIDIGIVRSVDDVTLARAAAGIRVSAGVEAREG